MQSFTSYTRLTLEHTRRPSLLTQTVLSCKKNHANKINFIFILFIKGLVSKEKRNCLALSSGT